MYRIAVVTSDLERDWASVSLLEAAQALASGSAVDPFSFRMQVDGDYSITVGGKPSDAYDAYIMRGFNRDGEVDYQYEVLELLEDQGKLVVNCSAGLSIAESKAQTTYVLSRAGLPVPRTIVTQDLDEAVSAIQTFGTTVIKPLYGSHGLDMEKIGPDSDDSILPKFLDKHRVVYLQEYVPNEGRDIRVFVVGDEIVGAVYRIAEEGNWRTNVAQGSSCAPCEPSKDIREMCLEATRTVGLDYTGVDVMEGPSGPTILELNGAPWWHGLSEATGRDVAADIVRHVLRKLDTGQSARQPAGLRTL